jgi:hypothetical protein
LKVPRERHSFLEEKAERTSSSRSLKVLKKSEKGLLAGHQRSFSFGRNLLQRADASLTE